MGSDFGTRGMGGLGVAARCGASVGFSEFHSIVGGLGGVGCFLFVGLVLMFAWVASRSQSCWTVRRWWCGVLGAFCSVCLGFCRLMGLSNGLSRSKQSFHLFK